MPVPVSLMQKAGTYYFVLRVWDNHANLHKDHQVKPALEMNATESSAVINLVATDLFKSPVPETEEENPGAFVHFNLDNDNDSDNNDGAPKHPGGDYIANETHGPVTGEDDLKRAKIFFGRQLGRLPNEGKVVLRVTLISGSRHMRVWKNPEKGAGNDVLVTVQEKEWDLSDPVQRQAFGQIKENLWVEGMEYNSKCWLEVEYKKQVGGQWQVVGSDKVKYTFIAADCGNQPRTDNGQRQRFENAFPNLVRCEWSITGEATPTYNCFAWSIGVTNQWIDWEVDSVWGDNDGTLESTDFDAFYQHFGYVRTTNIADADILLYRDPSQVSTINPEGITHAARRRLCNCGLGRWIMFESKCGGWERIEHRRDQLSGGDYGTPFRYYKRRNP
ncbi:hypothetical protein HRbin17_02056 [bacterium HR17]|uniref:DUF7689 domain-containing protein n=1 Tax=Candidatus Fervidibacter japonicus TaxID=2035412 RepID=A0A2H5XEB7_9BACT|nr:hypothetical protein HRbin17_02056 [bacterium HR17]